MESPEKNLNENESLDIIRQMIESAKERLEDDSFFYLLWGWLVFIACASQFILIKADSEYNFIGWLILMPLGGILSSIYGRKLRKSRRVKTYTDEVMKYVLIAFIVSLVMVLGFQVKLQLATYPMVLLVYGIWLFISGGAIKFRPLIIGGIIQWVIAVISFFQPFEIQLVLLAVAVVLGYIIPGYMLKAKFQQTSQVA